MNHLSKQGRADINFYNCDNIEFMKSKPDNFYKLAIVDPPYGIGFGKFNRTNKASDGTRIKADKYKNSDWDNCIPNDVYFNELKRISENQIVWGGNYFEYLAKKETPNLKTIKEFNDYINNSTENWIFWHKQNPVPNFADGELAWISFNDNNQFDFKYYGNLEGNTSASKKFHPTQKPVQLYKWLLTNYTKPNDNILDTHGGSASIALACWDLGFDLDLCELDEDYFNDSWKRFETHSRQQQLF